MEKANYRSRPYGHMIEKTSPFIIVAPHAAGDDAFTRYVVYGIVEDLQASAVINTTYIKPTNSKAEQYPERVEDFNKLAWWEKKEKHTFATKHKDMKTFYKDIFKLQESVRKKELGRSIIVHIHGMSSTSSCLDIGMGAWYNLGKGEFEDSSSVKENNGHITMPKEITVLLRKKMEEVFKQQCSKDITIGRHFPAWSRKSGIQSHATINPADWALQIEMDKSLRTNAKTAKHSGKLISQALASLI